MNARDAFELRYCPAGQETKDRLTALYEQRRGDLVSAVFEVPSDALRRFARTHPGGFCGWPETGERADFWEELLQERRAVRDDSVPAAYLSEFDQGLYGGLLGGEMRFLCDPATGWISSMVPPLFQELPAAEDLRCDYGGRLWRRYLDHMRALADRAAGKFGISHFILIDSLNLVFELVGATKTYLAMIESPDRLRGLVDFAFDLNVRVQEAFFREVHLVAGGTCSNMAGWVPGKIVSESVDPFHMTRVDDFERFGREPVERMFRHFDGGCLHLHGNGRHLLEAVASLPGLKCIYLGDDRGFPPAFEVLPELRRRSGDVPLAVIVEYEPFARALRRDELVGGVRYTVAGTPSVDDANRMMDRIRRRTPDLPN